MRIGVKPGVWGWTMAELEAFWATAEAAGFDHISAFDHPLAAPAPLRSWDAPSLLVAMAARTRTTAIGIEVIVVSWRNALELAAQVAVAQALRGSRVEITLGAGTRQLGGRVHRALGLGFPPHAERVARVERFCLGLPLLWRGERVSDEQLGLHEVSLGPLGIKPPPISVGGATDELLAVIARSADGWNYAQGTDRARYEHLSRRLDDLWASEGRAGAPFKTVQLAVDDLDLATIRARIAEFASAGADAVTLLFVHARQQNTLERLAGAVLGDVLG